MKRAKNHVAIYEIVVRECINAYNFLFGQRVKSVRLSEGLTTDLMIDWI